MHATSLLVLGLASAASAQLTNANDDPRLSERDNYGIGFGIGGPVLALLIGYALLRNSMRPHDLSLTLLSFIGTVLAIVGAATKSWFVADPAYARYATVTHFTQWSLWNVCYTPTSTPSTGWICSPYGTVLDGADAASGITAVDPTIHEKAKGALALIIIGLILSGTVIITTFIASKLPIGAKYVRYITVVIASASFLSLLVGWSIGMSISKNLEPILGVFPMQGFSNGLLILSYITMFFVVVVQLVGIWKSTLIDIKELALDEEDEPQDHSKTLSVLTVCAVVAAIIAIATNHWFTFYDTAGVEYQFGLHKVCPGAGASIPSCQQLSSTTLFASLGVLNGFAGSIVHKGKTTVGLTVIGLVIAFVGAVHLFISDGKKKLLRLSFAFLVVAATIQMIGWAAAESMRESIYHTLNTTSGNGVTIAWSEGLALTSWIGLYVLSLIVLLAVCGKPPAVTEDAKEPELSAVAVIGASTGLVVEESNVKATPAEPASAPEPAPVAEPPPPQSPAPVPAPVEAVSVAAVAGMATPGVSMQRQRSLRLLSQEIQATGSPAAVLDSGRVIPARLLEFQQRHATEEMVLLSYPAVMKLFINNQHVMAQLFEKHGENGRISAPQLLNLMTELELVPNFSTEAQLKDLFDYINNSEAAVSPGADYLDIEGLNESFVRFAIFYFPGEYDLNTNAGVLAAVEGMFLYLQEKGVPVVVKKGAQ